MLQLTAYKKYYHSQLVLDIPLLNLEGGIYWLKGTNGAGKTTLLKSIAGLIPFDGSITVNDLDIRKQRRTYLKQVNYAEAEPLYPPFLTGTDMVDFYEKTKGSNKKDTKELIEHFGMNHYLKNKISTYSSGMTKKLSLVLAFIGKPSLVLLDEPFITLDAGSIEVLQQLITDSNKAGVSFCISSHQQLVLGQTYKTLQIQNQHAELL